MCSRPVFEVSMLITTLKPADPDFQKWRNQFWGALWKSLKPVIEPEPHQVVDMQRWPHKCPRCSGPAYVGFAKVECAGGCR